MQTTETKSLKHSTSDQNILTSREKTRSGVRALARRLVIKQAVLPVIRERQAIANSFVEHLALLGLDRAVPAPPSIDDLRKQIHRRKNLKNSCN